jgi:outer membrane protein TolC
LDEEIQVQNEAVAAANQALELTSNQYQSGTISYQDVIIVQAQTLNNRQTALQLQGDRLDASVLLIKALGGGWHEKMLPTPEEAVSETKWTDYLIFPVE